MARRYRFFTWTTDMPRFTKLRQRIAAEGYSDEVGNGFILSKATRQEIEGRFVQRFTYVDELFGPDGSVVNEERVGYSNVYFRARPSSSGLVLVDPPRSTTAFFQRLSHTLDYDVTVQPSAIRLAQLKKELQRDFGRARITSVEIAGAALAEGAVADISVVDASDAFNKAIELFPQHRAKVTKIDMVFAADAKGLRLSASSSGGISVNDERSTLLEPIWRAVEVAAVSANGR